MENAGGNDFVVNSLSYFDSLLGKDTTPQDQNAIFRAIEIAERLNIAADQLPNVLKGKTVLDIGCGSQNNSIDSPSGKGFPPALCRLLSKLGAKVWGIDLGTASGEDKDTYTHIQADIIPYVLRDPNVLGFSKKKLANLKGIKDMKFDIINTSYFVGQVIDRSPQLERRLSQRGISMENFEALLLGQLKDMVNEGGLILMEKKHFKKENGQLTQLPPIKGFRRI